MNTDELTRLVQVARVTDEVVTSPPRDLVQRAHQSARRRRTGWYVIGSVAAVAILGGVLAATPPRSPKPSSPPTGPTRLVGANNIVLSVPAKWRTLVQINSQCPPDSPQIVQYFVRQRSAPVSSCDVRPGASWPAEDTLTVYTDVNARTPTAKPAGSVAGHPYYLQTVQDHQGPGVARALTIPDVHLRFMVGAATTHQADAVLRTVQRVPRHTTTIGLDFPDNASEPELTNTGHQFTTNVVEVDEGPSGQLPGQLLRTEPSIGTPAPNGTNVTLVFSAGDLNAYVDPTALQAAGWNVQPATTFEPPISRAQAEHIARATPTGRQGAHATYGTYLRTLDGRLVWLVTQREPDALKLTAVDSRTGRILKTHGFPARNQ